MSVEDWEEKVLLVLVRTSEALGIVAVRLKTRGLEI
jgi:hypothetical protein